MPLTNARGVFKRSLAEFAVLGMLYFTKRVRRLVDSQRAHKWDDFSPSLSRTKSWALWVTVKSVVSAHCLPKGSE